MTVLGNKIYFVMLLVAILFVSITQVIFKIIAEKHSDYLFNVIYDYRFYISLIIYIIAFGLWLVALSKIEFSIAVPFNIITIILGGIFGYYFFNESISIIKLFSYILITIGLLLLSYDSFKI